MLNYKLLFKRIDKQNEYWSNLISKISKIGPTNAAILDTEKGLIEKNEKQVLVINEELTKKIKFLKEGQFSEKEGATALKLVGEVHPIDSVEVIKVKKKNLLELYPLSCIQLIDEIRKRMPQVKVKQNKIYDIIKENNLKNNPDYSVYNFRNRTQEQEYEAHKKIPQGIPSIYNNNAVNFIIHLLNNV